MNVIEFKEKISGQKDIKIKIIVGALILGIALIFMSEVGGSKKSKDTSEVSEQDNLEYIEYMEERLVKLVESIDGVDEAKVMVTLENGIEYVYANENQMQRDLTEDMGEENSRLQDRLSKENKLIIIDGEGGNKTALVEKKLEPVIKGIAIVCSGRGGAVTEKTIVDTVTTVLGVGANQVNVAKLKD